MQFKNAMIYTEDFRFVSGAFSVKDGRFANVLGAAGADAVDLNGARVIPGLLDVHMHGAVGADLTEADVEGNRRMARYEAENGVTGITPATVTQSIGQLEKAMAAAAEVAANRRPGEARVWGVNMEGPYFSMKKKGAQNPAFIKNPDWDEFCRLNRAANGLIRIACVAPELPGALEFIEKASRVATVSVAHTAATFEEAEAAFRAGATQVTHLYNAMPGIHHREPGVIPAAADAGAFAELICDGLHVHPAAIRLAFRIFGAERIVMISDSLCCAGLPEGDYELGGQSAILKDGIARLPDGTIAGSASCLYEGLRRAVSFGVPAEDAVRAATWNPACQIGAADRIGSIAEGKLADFVVCDEQMNRIAVYMDGEKI